jgi:hypothetical protein
LNLQPAALEGCGRGIRDFKNQVRLLMSDAVIRKDGGEGSMTATAKIGPVALSLYSGRLGHPAQLLSPRATYRTELGAAYAADAVTILKALPDESVNAVITSPPYALHFKKEYGNVDKQSYAKLRAVDVAVCS